MSGNHGSSQIRALLLVVAAAASAACAETNAPLPEPVETLLVVNRLSGTLSVIPVDQPAAAVDLPLGAPADVAAGVAARDSIAVVALDGADAVVVVNLRSRAPLRTITLPAGSGATAAAIVDDSTAYVASAARGTVTRIKIWTGDTADVHVGGVPRGVAFARGRVFVLDGQIPASGIVETPASAASASWLTVVDPATNARALGIDSIPLTGVGGARFADIGGDGLLYVMNAGQGASEGRLSIVDPVTRTEIASFAGFGASPGNLAVDDDDRVFVSSETEGIMEFDARLRTVTRGAGSGVAVPTNAAVAVDSHGRVYAIEAGPCTTGNPGVAHVLDSALVQLRTVPLGECPIAATIVKVPQP